MSSSTILIGHEFVQLWRAFRKIGVPDEIQESVARIGVSVCASNSVGEILYAWSMEEAEAFPEDF